MKDNWKTYKIKDVGKVITGKTPSKNNPEEWGNEILFITPSDYKYYRKWCFDSERKLSKKGLNRLQKKLLPKNSLLVTCIGSDMGKVVINPFPVITNQQINSVILDFSKADSDFLYYLFAEKYEELKYLGSGGTAVPILNKSTFENLEIEIPSLPEQKAIAAVLSSLDDKIDLLHRQNKTLEALAETLFRQWFIEEAREDWEEGILDEILTVKGGTTPSTKVKEYWDGDIHWTAPRDLSNNQHIFLFDTARKITKKGLDKISSGLLPTGTILLSSRAPIGYLAITEIPLAINQGYIAIIDNKGFSKYFLYLWIKANLDYIISNANGSVFPEISKSVFRSLEIQKPPASLRSEFENQINPIFKKIRANSYQIRMLEKLRDTLLPKLMSGEIKVI